MNDMSVYTPHIKVLVAHSSEQLTDKTENYISKLINDGVDPEMIHVSDPSIAVMDRGYIICHTVHYYTR